MGPWILRLDLRVTSLVSELFSRSSWCSTLVSTVLITNGHAFALHLILLWFLRYAINLNTGTKSRWTYDTNGTTMSPVQYTTSQLHLRIFLHSSVSKFYLNDDVMTSTTDGTPLQGPPVSLVSYRPKQNMQVSLAVLVVTGASNTSILAVRARILHAPSLPKPWNARRFFLKRDKIQPPDVGLFDLMWMRSPVRSRIGTSNWLRSILSCPVWPLRLLWGLTTLHR
jgi:hypothetical protein